MNEAHLDTGPSRVSLAAVEAPMVPPPLGACDCHVHVFAPARHPYAADRAYTPGAAETGDLDAFLSRLGMARVVLVQPSVYASDHAALLEGLHAFGPDRARGIAVLEELADPLLDLPALHEQGVRGVRLNLAVRNPAGGPDTVSQLLRARDRIAPLGWHLQLHADIGRVAALAETLSALEIPVVLDHFAGLLAHPGAATAEPADTVVALVRAMPLYVKLSAPYRAAPGGAYLDELAAFTRRLADAAPERLLWASDWPHTGGHGIRQGGLGRIEPFRSENAGAALDRLRAWLPDPADRQRILVDNPARLYAFPVPGAPASSLS
ncbi:amidohydrolase family protein [Pigmentiphaga kullae]|uniref:Putative TIM-barrel fold metal-dependent hydrolase n=1 Tax=Pigmentiphaga kullae TaxID=151784 RepID=A0A4Q7NIJ6_9BURK|nr:amidohydrolase family protein [Pigmentiphaga kullae]RZS84688.1 putative TIM-barrel fold metal-dependent hydrolase [Pigmentiphaga kullae]